MSKKLSNTATASKKPITKSSRNRILSAKTTRAYIGNSGYTTIRPFKTVTPVFHWNIRSEKRIKVNQGGTSSSKTYSILQVLIVLCLMNKNWTVTVVGQDMPNLKVGPIRDLDHIFAENPYVKARIKHHNKGSHIIKFDTGSFIEFKSYDDEQDAKSGKRNVLFINEANGISYPIYEQLSVRTADHVFLDYNSDAPFWVHESVIGEKDVDFFISNFTHNPWCPKAVIRRLFYYKKQDQQRWRVYGVGMTGAIEGLIYPKVTWITEDQFPSEYELDMFGYGMDFGYSNDPTTLVKGGIQGNGIYLQGLLYATGYKDSHIINHLQKLNVDPYDMIWADSASPKAIDTIGEHFTIRGVKKGPDSVVGGINMLQDYNLYIVANKDFKHEQLNYRWAKNRSGKRVNKPVPGCDHYWDAARYWLMGMRGGTPIVEWEPQTTVF